MAWTILRTDFRRQNLVLIGEESIGSISNCVACHTTAEEGIYDDEDVKIPR